MKVFISFSTKDRKIAERLYADLVTAGAEVYQFGKSEKVGVSSWEQVLSWINNSDVFIVLVSQSSLKSQPVKDEIDHASYARSNSDGKKPAELIPAIIEAGAEPPLLIQRFATLDLISFETGVARLVKQLGLKRASAGPGPVPSLPDFSGLFFKYKELSPKPRPATLWSKEAEEILAKYKAVKPLEVKPEAERKHLDALLAGKSSEYDALFFGFKPDSQNKEKPPSGLPLLKDKLLSFDLSGLALPLRAPKLSSEHERLSWSPVAEAVAYVLEESADLEFKTSMEVYRGSETQYKPLMLGFYRVKATGGVFRTDSAWSDTVLHMWTQGQRRLDTPKLSSYGGVLSWAEIIGASSYVLERSESSLFEKREVVFKGAKTSYNVLGEFSSMQNLSSRRRQYYYRVKATSTSFGVFYGVLDSAWSEAITPVPSGPDLWLHPRK